jgi:hypothetical protein
LKLTSIPRSEQRSNKNGYGAPIRLVRIYWNKDQWIERRERLRELKGQRREQCFRSVGIGEWREREKGKSLVQLVATGERCMKKRIEGGFVCFEIIFYYHTTRTVYGDLDLFSDI